MKRETLEETGIILSDEDIKILKDKIAEIEKEKNEK